MGARTTWEIQTNETTSLYLYSHWGGGSKLRDTIKAIRAAEPRWSDLTYCARIIVSQIVGDSWADETGFGLDVGEPNQSPFEEEYFRCVIDLIRRTVQLGDEVIKFDDFIHNPPMAVQEVGYQGA